MNQETYAVINDGAEFVALKTALRGLQFRIDRGHKVPKLTKCVTLVLCDKIPIVETCNDKDCSPKLLLTLDGIRQLRYLIDCDKIKLNTRLREDISLKLEYLLTDSEPVKNEEQSYRQKVASMEKMYASRKNADIPR